jgi:hypothetical protein
LTRLFVAHKLPVDVPSLKIALKMKTLTLLLLGWLACSALAQVVLREVPAEQKVEVTIDGRLFTAYRYPTSIKKPVLYPVLAASGTEVTRGYPLAPRAGERVDHPHHVGAWLNFGRVNGLDFWNNAGQPDAAHGGAFGSIVHRRIVALKSGKKTGKLVVEAAWLDPAGRELLRERTTFTFAGGPNRRSVARTTTLTALDQQVVFEDNKEGLFAIRVARQLEAPADKPEVFTDASGRPTPVPTLDNTGVTGRYTSREGLRGTDAMGNPLWGKPSAWVRLDGTIGSEPVTLAMLDHPQNPNHPARWHARGYGLFAVNNLGQQVFDPAQPEFSMILAPGKSLTLRHKLVVFNTAVPAQADIDQEWTSFTKEK